jgi:hypothetical protein
VPIIIALGENVDMIRWADRLASDNHCFMFPVGVSGIVDCFPIRVQTPRKYAASRYLYQPKYGFCVFKVQLVISLKGEIVFASFPHLGVDHDSKIWKASLANGDMQFHDNEWILGDPVSAC